MRKYKDDKPTGYAKEKEFSFRMFAVPTTQTLNAKVLRGAALINHYLENPTKQVFERLSSRKALYRT